MGCPADDQTEANTDAAPGSDKPDSVHTRARQVLMVLMNILHLGQLAWTAEKNLSAIRCLQLSWQQGYVTLLSCQLETQSSTALTGCLR